MAQIDKNTVKGDKQLGQLSKVRFEKEDGAGVRVLFAGNSITRHASKPEIGWEGDWGMAASSMDKDYVHVLENLICQKNPDATFCTCQVSDWEVNFRTGEEQFYKFCEARDFDADIIVLRLIENCNKDFDGEIFRTEYEKLVAYLDKNSKAKIIVTTSFWKHPGDDVLKEIAQEFGYDFVYLGDLGEDSKMRADGLFEHSGVAAHPSDLGMEEIAKRIFSKVINYID